MRELYTDAQETPIRSLAVNKFGTKLVAGNNLGMCLIWDKRDGEVFEPMQELDAHRDSYVLKCQFSSTGEFLATCSSDKTCSVWQLNDVEEEDKEGETY